MTRRKKERKKRIRDAIIVSLVWLETVCEIICLFIFVPEAFLMEMRIYLETEIL